MSEKRLEKKVALITGAAKGIGRSISEAYAREGADLVITDILPNLKQTAEQVKRLGSGKVLARKMDVRQAEDIEEVVAKTIDELGRIDILVSNAGVCKTTLVVDMSEDEWDYVLDTNLKGVFLCSRTVAKEMIRLQTKGKIIALGSIMSRIGESYFAHYTASKHGVLGFVRCLAFELAPYDINVNAICPGFVDTDMERDLELAIAEMEKKNFEDIRSSYVDLVPLRRFAHPEDIAKMAVFLASSDSDFVTGQGYNVCGGVVMS